MKQLKKTKHNNNLGLKELLVEADKITLNDLDFNKILKEQTSILCNIQKMLHYENNINNNEAFKCKLSNLKNLTFDYQLLHSTIIHWLHHNCNGKLLVFIVRCQTDLLNSSQNLKRTKKTPQFQNIISS
jgi:hypothetical protein